MKKRIILILSIEDDPSTTKVLRWLHYLDKSVRVVRLHPEDLAGASFALTDIHSPLIIQTKGIELCTSDIAVVWTRKWNNIPNADKYFRNNNLLKVKYDIIQNLKDEFSAFFRFFLYKISDNNNVCWIDAPRTVVSNKLQQLLVAQKLGLIIPETYIGTSYKEGLPEKLISKHISDCFSLYMNKKIYTSYTCRAKLSPKEEFFVSMFQSEIPKKIELRILYVGGQCYGLAIFSQMNSKTRLDYRNYDYDCPVREEVYEIPVELETKISKLMCELDLQIGVLDFILSPEGEYIFLEVNPCGQYDNFNLCNIFPDRVIAQYLLRKYYEY